MSSRNYQNGKPTVYAREKLSMLQRRVRDAQIGPAIIRCTSIGFPGAPAEVMFGFTAFSTSPTENTTEAVRTQPFHEVGLFQIEAGMRAGPAPNPDVNARYNSWGKLANSAVVRQMLNGRSATMTPNAWKRAIDDQVAVGVANLLRHRESFARNLPRLASQRIDSNWSILTAFTTFSRGAGQTKNVLTPYVDRLAAVPEDQRWRTFRSLVAQDIARQTPGIGSRVGKQGAAYAIVRSEQKFMSGALLAANGGNNARWFEPSAYRATPEDAAIEDAISRAAYSADLSSAARDTVEAATRVASIAVGTVEENKIPVIIAAVIGVGLVGTAIYSRVA